jgi:hypothetical protein
MEVRMRTSRWIVAIAALLFATHAASAQQTTGPAATANPNGLKYMPSNLTQNSRPFSLGSVTPRLQNTFRYGISNYLPNFGIFRSRGPDVTTVTNARLLSNGSPVPVETVTLPKPPPRTKSK